LTGSVLRLPLIGSAGFNLLVSQASIRHYLRQVYADPGAIDESTVAQNWATAHQPNARVAPAAFLAGRLDLPLSSDGAPSQAQIRAPILVLRGSEPGLGAVASDDELARLGPHVTIRTIDGVGSLPHVEAPDDVVRTVEAWLGQPS
jgi:pimeloyl-ACP methyl ester carboxylesterase